MAVPEGKRSWRPRFGLRFLMFLVTFVAVLLGFYRFQIQPYLSQQDAIAVFQEVGGSVTVEARGPAWLRSVVGEERMQSIVDVDLSNCRVNDECLHWLSYLPELRTYRIGYRSPGTTETPQYEDGLWTAEYLNLTNCTVTDRGLEHLQHCDELETLFLINTPTTDVGIAPLAKLKSLKTLWVTDTKVSDDVVERIRLAKPMAFVGN